MILKEGTSIAGGKYIIETRLGKGGQAEVWKAQQLGVGGFSKDVVIKIVHAEALDSPKMHEMFLAEAQLAAQLQHPNIVEIYDIGQFGGLDYIVMELIRGRDLGQLLEAYQAKHSKPLPWALVAQMMIGVCKALYHAHTSRGRDGQPLNMIHRDLKPENMLLTVDGFVKLIDFGMAKASNNQHKTQTGMIKGTPSYMSPEQITSRPQDARSDLFALGIIMYELCSGHRPFLGDMLPTLIYSILENKPESLLQRFPEISPSFDAVVLKLLEKKPEDRFEDARVVQRTLEKILREEAPADFHRDSLNFFAQEYAQPRSLSSTHVPILQHSSQTLQRPTYTPSPIPSVSPFGGKPATTPHPISASHVDFGSFDNDDGDDPFEATMTASLEDLKRRSSADSSLHQISPQSLTEAPPIPIIEAPNTQSVAPHTPAGPLLSGTRPAHLPPGAVVGLPTGAVMGLPPGAVVGLPPGAVVGLPPGAVVGKPTAQTIRENAIPKDDQERLRQALLAHIAPAQYNNALAEQELPPLAEEASSALAEKSEQNPPKEVKPFVNNEDTEDLEEAISSGTALEIPKPSNGALRSPASPGKPTDPDALEPFSLDNEETPPASPNEPQKAPSSAAFPADLGDPFAFLKSFTEMPQDGQQPFAPDATFSILDVVFTENTHLKREEKDPLSFENKEEASDTAPLIQGVSSEDLERMGFTLPPSLQMDATPLVALSPSTSLQPLQPSARLPVSAPEETEEITALQPHPQEDSKANLPPEEPLLFDTPLSIAPPSFSEPTNPRGFGDELPTLRQGISPLYQPPSLESPFVPIASPRSLRPTPQERKTAYSLDESEGNEQEGDQTLFDAQQGYSLNQKKKKKRVKQIAIALVLFLLLGILSIYLSFTLR